MKMLPEATPSLGEEIEECNFHSNLLIDDEPLQVLPKLAVAIGLDEAIVVQQLHYWLNPKRKSGKIINGRRWIYNTYAEWRETNFPFWSEIHIKRTFLILEKCGIIVSCQPEGAFSRRKYYRINEGFLLKAKRGELGKRKSERIKQIRSTDQVDTIIVSKNAVPITETTLRDHGRESKEAKETPPHPSEDDHNSFPSTWKPKQGTKEQKLLMLPTPNSYPSEIAFDRHLYDNGLDAILTYRPDLYADLCHNKWHLWNERSKKWLPIVNWKKFVTGLNDKITNAYQE